MMMYLVHTLIFIDSVISNFLLVFAIHSHEMVVRFLLRFGFRLPVSIAFWGRNGNVTQFFIALTKSTSLHSTPPSVSINGNDNKTKNVSANIFWSQKNIDFCTAIRIWFIFLRRFHGKYFWFMGARLILIVPAFSLRKHQQQQKDTWFPNFSFSPATYSVCSHECG